MLRELKKADKFFDKDETTLWKEVVDIAHNLIYNAYIFWITPEGKVIESPGGHKEKTIHMMSTEEYENSEKKDWIRGRMVTTSQRQVIIVYTSLKELLYDNNKLSQLRRGIEGFPLPAKDDCVIATRDGILGTVADIYDF